MNIINLTPHKLNIYSDGLAGFEQVLELESSGVARCATSKKAVGEIRDYLTSDGMTGIRLYETAYGEVTGLPEPQPDTIYVVSLLVRQATPERADLYSPGELMRDGSGQPIGCIGLSK